MRTHRIFSMLLAILVGFFLVTVVATCPGQVPAVAAGSGPFNYGYVVDSARVELEQAWDTHNPRQVERGYCIEASDVEIDTATDHSAIGWKVHHVRAPVSVDLATPYAIAFNCSDSAIASIHIHTPTTCLHDPKDPLGQHPKGCILGGDDSAICSVDEPDRMAARKDLFMAIQCDKHAFVFYWAGRRG